MRTFESHGVLMSSRFRRTAWSLGLLAAALVTASGGSDAAPEAPVAAEQSAFTLQLLHVSDADGYPFPLEADMLNLAKLETAMTPATAGGAASTSTATLGSEQDALMKYFTSQYASTPAPPSMGRTRSKRATCASRTWPAGRTPCWTLHWWLWRAEQSRHPASEKATCWSLFFRLIGGRAAGWQRLLQPCFSAPASSWPGASGRAALPCSPCRPSRPSCPRSARRCAGRSAAPGTPAPRRCG